MVSIVIDTLGAISYHYSMGPETANQDGRHARLEHHKAELVRALLVLIRETGDVPTADVLAERAQVSRRTVFRLFDDRAALLRAMFDLMYAELLERFPFPDVSQLPFEDRITGLVDHLASIYEYITPFRRVSERQRANESLIEKERGRIQELYGNQIRAVFEGVTPRSAASVASTEELLQLITSFKVWDHLRTERKHSVAESKSIVHDGLMLLAGR